VTRSEFAERLATRAHAATLTLPAHLIEPLWSYFELLATWNRRINLTAIDLHALPDDGVDRLFIEPLAAARYASTGGDLIDIGSGGGSPAIPFALGTAATSLAMVESRTRKSVFLREAARVVALPAEVVTERYQALTHNPAFRKRFDLLTIRAVRIEDQAIEMLRGLVRPGGRIFSFEPIAANADRGATPGIRHPLTGDAAVHILNEDP
jgi:16S rRNA (guanine527-N7)-methyltransferase